jgi:hypothetical protein
VTVFVTEPIRKTVSCVFAGNGFRCPLTRVAERLGAEHGSVTDIYLPRWFARNLPAIHVPLIGLAGYLHVRNLRARQDGPSPISGALPSAKRIASVSQRLVRVRAELARPHYQGSAQASELDAQAEEFSRDTIVGVLSALPG